MQFVAKKLTKYRLEFIWHLIKKLKSKESQPQKIF